MSIRKEQCEGEAARGTGSLHMTIQTVVLIETLTSSAPMCWVSKASFDAGSCRSAVVVLSAGKGGTAQNPKGTQPAWKGETPRSIGCAPRVA